MTIQEAGIVLDILSAAYPRFYAGEDKERRKTAMKLWASMFQNEEIQDVLEAIMAFISGDQKGFPPNIGIIKAKLPKQSAQALPLKGVSSKQIQESREQHRMLEKRRRAIGLPATWNEAQAAGLSAAAWWRKLEQNGLNLGMGNEEPAITSSKNGR